MLRFTFDRVFGHEFENENRLLLTISVRSRDRLTWVNTHSDFASEKDYLEILVWIEVRFEDDDRIRTPEVDANPTRTCGQDVDEHVRALGIEEVHLLLALRLLLVSVLIIGSG